MDPKKNTLCFTRNLAAVAGAPVVVQVHEARDHTLAQLRVCGVTLTLVLVYILL